MGVFKREKEREKKIKRDKISFPLTFLELMKAAGMG